MREFGEALEQTWGTQEMWKRDSILKSIVVGYNIDLLNIS